MSQGQVILRFSDVDFSHGDSMPILDEVSFSVRRGSKLALMGQNGAGKTTMFDLITGKFSPEEGSINIVPGVSVATAKQVIPQEQMDLTVRDFFQSCFEETVYDIDPKIDSVLEIVHLDAPKDRTIRSFSGGQQARLLLASALVQSPDILLLDEPTNNLDKEGIQHLTDFLKSYNKTCIVISHDSDFLNSFTTGVLYLDVFTKKVEQYVGNYHDLVKEITRRIEAENRKNAQLAKEIQENKDKANYFSHKGGKMRVVAKKMKTKAEAMEDEKVEVRREDKTIRPFEIPAQRDIGGEILKITSFNAIIGGKTVTRKADVSLRKNEHLLITGANGVGKSTLLESLAEGTMEGAKIADDVVVGYYMQDFSNLNYEETVRESLSSAAVEHSEERMRAVAANLLITKEIINSKIGSLSEGQKGLLSFARLILQRPGLLILDEPTNHINFRHLPVIASGLNKYEGAMVLVSHVPDFVEKIRIDETLNMEK